MSVCNVFVSPLVLCLFMVGCSNEPTPVVAASPVAQIDESTAEGLVKAAEVALKSMNLVAAISKLEAALELDPDYRKALLELIQAKQLLANDASRRNDKAATLDLFLQVGTLARRLNQPPQEPSQDELALIHVAFYNEACAYALKMQREKALSSLGEAIASGFKDITLLETDPDLTLIRRDPQFAAILVKAQDQARAQAKVLAEALIVTVPPYSIDFTVEDPEGHQIHLAEIKGDVTVLNLWGTWCGPCRQQVGQLAALAIAQKTTGLVVLGLNFEDGTPNEVQATVRKIMAESKLPYQCLIGDDNVLRAIPDLKGYPTTLFLDASGQVRAQLLGYQDRFMLDAIVRAIRDEAANTSK